MTKFPPESQCQIFNIKRCNTLTEIKYTYGRTMCHFHTVWCCIIVVSRTYYNYGIYILSKLKKDNTKLRHRGRDTMGSKHSRGQLTPTFSSTLSSYGTWPPLLVGFSCYVRFSCCVHCSEDEQVVRQECVR